MLIYQNVLRISPVEDLLHIWHFDCSLSTASFNLFDKREHRKCGLTPKIGFRLVRRVSMPANFRPGIFGRPEAREYRMHANIFIKKSIFMGKAASQPGENQWINGTNTTQNTTMRVL